MAPLRIGVIGLGLIWVRTHQQILASLRDDFELVAFCDLSEQRRAAAAQAFPGAPVLSDHHELLARPEIEAVLVLTPLALNAPVARAALVAGKHVIMEKPIARSVAEGRALVDLARQSGRRLIVTEQLAYRQAEAVLAELIAEGAIGDLMLWDRVQHLEADTAQGELRYENTPWRKQADFPLGTMFDGGIHLIASLSKLFGAPAAVAATGRQLRPEYGEYDHIATLFQYANGSSGMLSYSSYLPATHNHFQIYGTTGVIVAEPQRLVVSAAGQPGRVVDLPGESPYVAMWQTLAQAFRERREPFYTAERALQDVAILEAVDQSIKTGARVAVAVQT